VVSHVTGYCFSLVGHEKMNSAWDYNPIDIQLEDVISYSQVYKGGVSMQAYCMKCRTKREMSNPKAVKMKNDKPATQGVCPKCGTKMFRIGKS
jgi:hypothetical protein